MSERFLELLYSVKMLGESNLDKRSAQILIYMLTSRETEFNHNQLRKALETQDIHIPEGTFTDRLDKLEALKFITRERGGEPGLGFREKTVIKLNISDPSFSSYFRDTKKAVGKTLDAIRSEATGMAPKEIYKKLRALCLDQVAVSLFTKLQMVNEVMSEEDYALSNMFLNVFYGAQSDMYVACLKERSKKVRKAVLAEAKHDIMRRGKVTRF